MTRKEIQNAIFFAYDRTQNVIAMDIHYVVNHPADVLVVRKSGTAAEFCIKESFQEFLHDFRAGGKNSEMKTKDPRGPQFFYYVCEPGVIPLTHLPDYAGLIYARQPTKTGGIGKTEIMKEAERLHKEKDPRVYQRICRSLMYRR